MLPAVLLAAVYLIWSPPSADLAAQSFRVDLFEAYGFEAWSSAWYGGIHPPGYSLIFPPLAALFGERVVGAVSAVAATWLFGALVRPRYGDRARLAIWLFGIGSATSLFTGRLTFALGVAIALAGLLALDRRHLALGAGLAALSAWASPVAGLFVAFAGGVLFLCGRRRDGVLLAAPAVVAVGVLVLAFPGGGMEPFAGNTFFLIVAATAILALLLPRDERLVRTGAVLYAAMCLALFLVDTPIGGNATRLGALVAAPLLALGAWGRRPAGLVALALVPLLYWQWVAPVRDLADAVGEPSVEKSYYEPLLAELERRGPDEAFRVHIPPTRNRWEATFVGERFELARGWLRQAEADDFELFRDGNLDAAEYRAWLDERAVAFVAISTGAEPDYLSEDEIALVRSGPSFLDEVWSDEQWMLYEVADPAPLAPFPATLERNGFTIYAGETEGEVPVAVRFSPYFRFVTGSGCLREADDWTVVEPRGAGPIAVEADLTVAGMARALTRRGEVCSD